MVMIPTFLENFKVTTKRDIMTEMVNKHKKDVAKANAS